MAENISGTVASIDIPNIPKILAIAVFVATVTIVGLKIPDRRSFDACSTSEISLFLANREIATKPQ